MRKFMFPIALLAVCVAFFPDPGHAQVQAHFTYDAVVNCDKPSVHNYPIHGEGTGKLSTDRSATLEHQSNVGGRDTYNVKLGAAATATADGGSASLRVLGRRSLRAIREFPNNLIIVDLRVSGASCSMTIVNRLKPGQRQYTFPTPLGMAFCNKPQVVKTSCSPI
jgi:hypothetical protein